MQVCLKAKLINNSFIAADAGVPIPRGYRYLFFWDLFFQGSYLFVENLLTVSRF
jgi:hypothetical protein